MPLAYGLEPAVCSWQQGMASTFWGRNRARRLAWPVVVAAALALPAQTGAGTGTTPIPFKGPLIGGGSVKFDLVQPAGGGHEVANFAWNNLRIRCRSGKHKHDGNFDNPIPVDPKTRYFEFEGIRPDGRGSAKVNGTFNGAYDSVQGVLKVSGRTGWGGHCRSGWVGWGAQPVTPPP